MHIDKFGRTMHFVALLGHHNSKIKMYREKRLHLNCSPDRYLLIKPLTKKIKWVVKEKTILKIDKFGWTMHFVELLDHHNSKIKMFRGKRLHLKRSPDIYLLIKPLTKKIKRVVKEKNHFEKWQIWINYAFCGTFGPT